MGRQVPQCVSGKSVGPSPHWLVALRVCDQQCCHVISSGMQSCDAPGCVPKDRGGHALIKYDHPPCSFSLWTDRTRTCDSDPVTCAGSSCK